MKARSARSPTGLLRATLPFRALPPCYQDVSIGLAQSRYRRPKVTGAAGCVVARCLGRTGQPSTFCPSVSSVVLLHRWDSPTLGASHIPPVSRVLRIPRNLVDEMITHA